MSRTDIDATYFSNRRDGEIFSGGLVDGFVGELVGDHVLLAGDVAVGDAGEIAFLILQTKPTLLDSRFR